ncbi:hypothetical protein BCV69DRAFT_296226 [Microstroma glucosiphilum]|uniref:Uncharacterized protein n=1 Tax=Pseudomicrostroma glucosiphilum TaxID=1684307 RepID=A0A316UG48_9BASI|nr:hypothetical protein BCV69DRAFT_296226 [Pseudomicrostroma glucosiphilum]PWN23918.1 hypothetical protein BCV69DRAFT_296226 [Pseudomicrostroma glucosiphilum]
MLGELQEERQSKAPPAADERRAAKKRRKGDAGQWHLESTKAVKSLSASDYAKLVQDCPTGHLLDATTEDTPRAGGRRSLRRWLPPRAHRLPFMRHFVEELHEDVAILLNTFASQWKQIKMALERQDEQAGSSSAARSPMTYARASELALAGPLALFVSIWKRLGWHAVQLHWSEEAETRARFFEVTSRAFLNPCSLLSESSTEDELLAATAAVYALYLLHTLQPSPPVPIPGLQNSYYRWAFLPGQREDASWNPYAEAGRQRIKVEIDVLEKMMALPQKASAALSMSRQALDDLHARLKLARDDDRLDFCTDTRYVLRKLCGEAASADTASRHEVSAFHVLPHSSIPGIRNPPHLPFFEDVSSEAKQKKEGKWGNLKPKAGAVHDVDTVSTDQRPINLSRSDNLLIRAAEQLRQPLNASTLPPLAAQTSAADQSTSYDFAQKDTATAWAGSWIEVPFRSKELPRRAKWEASQRDVERLSQSYEQSKAEVAGSSSPASMLNIDLVKLMKGDTAWSGRSVDEQLQQMRDVPLTSAESIFEEARKLTGDTILRGMAKKANGTTTQVKK